MTEFDLVTSPSQSPEFRQNFPGVNHKVYFNYGGQGILPRSSLDAILSTYQFLEENGPFSIKANAWIQEKTALLRQDLAKELGTTPETLTITDNVTAGCNIVLWGLDWQAGDHLLMTDCEHPGVIGIVEALVDRFGITYSTCPIAETLNEGDPAQVIGEHLTPKTRLVLVSHLLWNTGQVLPLSEIMKVCRQYSGDYPVQVLVDAAQSAGSLSLNLSELDVDYYAFTGHKWFCGPSGVGGLYVNPLLIADLRPTYVGWRGITYGKQGEMTGWKTDGSRFEIATSAYPQFEGLRAAIAVHQSAGNSQERYQQICQNSSYLWEGLKQIPQLTCLKNTPPEAGLVSFEVKNELSQAVLVQNLEKEGFFVRTIGSPNCIRACCHYFTSPEEIDGLLKKIVEKLKTVTID
jgi:L-cysteine/cystine lyase